MEEYKRMNKSLTMRAYIARYYIYKTRLIKNSGLYKELKPIDSARYNSKNAPPGCLEGTRSSVLSLLLNWSRVSSPEFGVFWLSGTAGTGKTTIAKTFCDQLALEGTLGSSFFISNQDETRRDPHNIIRTLAYDLAVLNPSRTQSVWDYLNTTPNIASLHITEQTRCLLARPSPLQPVVGNSTIVVIDALDELDETANETGDLVALLVSALKEQAVKLVVTSRNEPRISSRLSGFTNDTLKLHRMEQSSVWTDVRTFYETHFRQLKASRRLNVTDWPSSTDLDVLTNRTGYLFVYAATIVKFVSAPRFSPVQRLHSILAAHHEPFQGHVVFYALDLLYTQIIESAVMIEGDTSDHLRNRVKRLIGAIIVLQHPLQLRSIASLLLALDDTCSEDEVRSDLESLASVIPVPDSETDTVEIFHLSFPDYMQDPKRSKDRGLTICSSNAHLDIAIACLRLMNTHLHKDICDISDSSVANTNIADLQAHLDNGVPESLRYACTY
jgi:hypothetical protein